MKVPKCINYIKHSLNKFTCKKTVDKVANCYFFLKQIVEFQLIESAQKKFQLTAVRI